MGQWLVRRPSQAGARRGEHRKAQLTRLAHARRDRVRHPQVVVSAQHELAAVAICIRKREMGRRDPAGVADARGEGIPAWA